VLPKDDWTTHGRVDRDRWTRAPSRGYTRLAELTLRSVALSYVMCHNMAMDATIVLGQQGRLVIPAKIRKALSLAAGDPLHLRVAGGRLVLERPQDAVSELRRLGAAVPPGRSLVEELLAERRAEAAAE
jgi:antitoxin PrlF